VLLQITGRDDKKRKFKNVTVWDSSKDACAAMVCLLLSAEYGLYARIDDVCDEEERDEYLDSDDNLKDEHCESEEAVRDLMDNFFSSTQFKIHIYSLKDIRGQSDKTVSPKRKSPPGVSAPRYCLCAHTGVHKPSDKTYHATTQEALREANRLELTDYDIFDVKLSPLYPESNSTEAKVCLELLYEPANEHRVKDIGFYHSYDAALSGVTMFLESKPDNLTAAISRHGSEVEKGIFLGDEKKLQDVHYAHEGTIRFLIEKFLPGSKFDFVITDINAKPKKARVRKEKISIFMI
jgi:hypothetical protein